MRDPRFAQMTGPNGYSDNLGGWFPDEQAAHHSFVSRVIAAEKIAQRRLTRAEVLKGVEHPQPDRQQSQTDSLRRQRELAPPTKPPSVAEARLASAKQRQFDSLPKVEQDVITAQRQLESEWAQIAEAHARAEALSTPQAKSLQRGLDHWLSMALYDETVPQAVIDELRHLQNLLTKFADVDAVDARFGPIVDQILGRADRRVQEAKEIVDRVAARRDAMMRNVKILDTEPVINVGILGERVASICYLGQSKTVPADQVEGRSHAEILSTHFGVSVTPVE